MISVKDEEKEERREIAEAVFFEDNFEVATDDESCHANYMNALQIFYEKYAAAEDMVERICAGEIVDQISAAMVMQEMFMSYKYALRFRQQLTGKKLVNPATIPLEGEPSELAMKGNELIGRYNAESHNLDDYETGKWLLYNAARL